MSIKLSSTDGKTFTASKPAMKRAALIDSLIEDMATDDVIPVPDVNSTELQQIIDYCEYHVNEEPRNIPKPVKTKNIRDVVCEFDAKLVDVKKAEELFPLLKAANYLNVASLMDLCCAKIAILINDLPPAEIRKTFGIGEEKAEETKA